MKRFSLRLLAASSCLCATLACAATRPRYGGTLRVQVQEAPATLDPAAVNGFASPANLSRLLFDTLVVLDDKGNPQPWLAISWQSESNDQRWEFQLREGVAFSDGAPLTAEMVAASLRTANPQWKVSAAGQAVMIQCDAPDRDLPSELALTRNGIVDRASGVFGTGPFTVSRWDPGKELVLTAREDYWRGRPFVDSTEIEMGKSPRAQMLALDLNKADVVEIGPEQQRSATTQGERVESSQPSDLMALVFARNPQNESETHLRQALAFSIDRKALNDVVLQGGGEPAGGLLPQWMSGYEFLFSSAQDLTRARQERSQVSQAPGWALAFDANDPLMRVIAERIALNARDAGVTIQLAPGAASADITLVRAPLVSLNARVALGEFSRELGLSPVALNGGSENDLYAAERQLLSSGRVIPLLHLRRAVGLSGRVENWNEGSAGGWNIPNIWLEATAP